MSIESPDDLKGLAEAGRIVRLALTEMAKQVRPGITTAELDGVAARIFRDNGAISAPKLVYGFPADVCISVNEEAVHGIPKRRALRAGDLVKLDVTVVKDGYMHVQAGAGVVYDSDPAYEQRETVNKAQALFRAAEEAVRFATRAKRGQ